MGRERLDELGTEAVALKIADGATYREIAGDAHVGLGTLCAWIESDPERSQACARAREISAQAFEERAQEEIQHAKDPFELSKAKELAIHWRWRAAVTNPKYNPKTEHKHSGSLTIKTAEQELAELNTQAAGSPKVA